MAARHRSGPPRRIRVNSLNAAACASLLVCGGLAATIPFLQEPATQPRPLTTTSPLAIWSPRWTPASIPLGHGPATPSPPIPTPLKDAVVVLDSAWWDSAEARLTQPVTAPPSEVPLLVETSPASSPGTPSSWQRAAFTSPRPRPIAGRESPSESTTAPRPAGDPGPSQPGEPPSSSSSPPTTPATTDPAPTTETSSPPATGKKCKPHKRKNRC